MIDFFFDRFLGNIWTQIFMLAISVMSIVFKLFLKYIVFSGEISVLWHSRTMSQNMPTSPPLDGSKNLNK